MWVQGNEVKFHHIIKMGPVKDWREGVYRIRAIKDELAYVLYSEVSLYIKCIVLEGYSYGSRFQSHQLGEVGYMFRDYLLDLFPSKFYVVPPKTLVKFTTGNGNSKKKDVAEKLQSMGIELPTSHHYDACSAAMFAQGICTREGLSKPQIAVLEKYLGRNERFRQ